MTRTTTQPYAFLSRPSGYLPDAFFDIGRAMAAERRWSWLSILQVLAAETGCRPDANYRVDIVRVGMSQVPKASLQLIGWSTRESTFVRMNAVDQLPFVFQHLDRLATGPLRTPTEVYRAIFALDRSGTEADFRVMNPAGAGFLFHLNAVQKREGWVCRQFDLAMALESVRDSELWRDMLARQREVATLPSRPEGIARIWTVGRLWSALKRLGYVPKTAFGQVFPTTDLVAALLSVQANHGLPTNGLPTEATRQVLLDSTPVDFR